MVVRRGEGEGDGGENLDTVCGDGDCGRRRAWEDLRRERAQLQEQLKAAQMDVQAASAREASRRSELEEELAEIARQRKSVHSPAQVIEALPQLLPLPTPLKIEEAPPTNTDARAAAHPGAPEASEPRVTLPVEDLKPLYDYALGCKACQEELAAALADLKDEKAKTQALGRERDSALRVARGGSASN